MPRRLVVVALVLALANACGGGSPTRPTTPVVPVAPTPPPDPAPSPPTPSPPPGPTLGVTKIMAFGDSMTEGFIETDPTATSRFFLSPRGVDAVAAYPAQLERLLRERYPTQDIVVRNEGRSGEWASDGQFRLPPLVRASRPQVVLLMEGGNDLTALRERGIELAVAALENMLRDARADGATVMLAGLPPRRPGSTRGEWPELVGVFNERVRALAQRQKVTFVDIEAAFGGNQRLLSVDGLHPNADGYLRIAETFRDVIVREFEHRTTGTVP
jgi:lysophospholipase L1-like esterase